MLRPFALAASLVTTGDWLAFMADGGYRRPELWMSDGWCAVQGNAWQAPGYWDQAEGWQVFTLEGLRPLDPDAAVVHVSWYEADAYARWLGGGAAAASHRARSASTRQVHGRPARPPG